MLFSESLGRTFTALALLASIVVAAPGAQAATADSPLRDLKAAIAAAETTVEPMIAAGVDHTCALFDTGEVKCWGGNRYGQLGIGDTDSRGDDADEMGDNLPAIDLGTDGTVTAISAGYQYTCALFDTGTVKCWGANGGGQLGLGDTNSRGDDAGEMGDALPAIDLGTGITATAVYAGYEQTCAVLNTGAVKCWGGNSYGQLGLGDTDDRGNETGEMGDALPAVDLGTGMTASAVAVGEYHTCVLLTSAEVKCWGSNWSGQLGLGDSNARGDDVGEMGDALPVVDLGTGASVTQIAAGSEHTCALLTSAEVKCWGLNGSGQLGLGDSDDRGSSTGEMGDALPAADLGSGVTVTAIDAGYEFSCALLADGGVLCWGNNFYGQLGVSDADSVGDESGEMGSALNQLDLGSDVVVEALSLGQEHTCALLDSGAVKCVGLNHRGQLGLGDNDDRGDGVYVDLDDSPPIDLGTGATASVIDSWSSATCATLVDGDVKCWGSNLFGQFGVGDVSGRGDEPGTMGDALPSVELGSTFTATDVAVAATHVCALSSGGELKCWGSNRQGQLGLGDTTNRGATPDTMGDALPVVNLGTAVTASALSAGGFHTCSVLDSGSVKCWGLNRSGQLGLGDTTRRLSPVEVDLGSGAVAVAITARDDHTCAVLASGSVKCWGANASGQLGLGDTDPRGYVAGQMGDALPEVDLGAGAQVTQIAAGNAHTCALLSSGVVKCWGSNGHGQLGLGDTDTRGDAAGEMGDALPSVDLGSGVTATAISAGDYHTCALLDSGSVKCWGRNDSGELGLGDSATRGDEAGEMGDALPVVALGDGATIASIDAGFGRSCAVLTSGVARCWGENRDGKLGLEDSSLRVGQGSYRNIGDELPVSVVIASVVEDEGAQIDEDVPTDETPSFVSLTPSRILDTRGSDPVGELDGSGDAYVLQVTGVGGVPSSGVSAVALNVTVVDGQANDFGGFVTVFPCGTRPDASNLNFVSGQTVPNSVIAPLSTDGAVCLYVYGQADLLVDVSGYFVSGFEPLTPDRILDTRGSDPVGELDGSGDAYSLQVTGSSVPSSATAVALNVTVVDGQANDFGGFVTVFPCGTRPDASNLNFVSGQTVPNSVIAPLSASGAVCLYVYGVADLLVDVSGYFTSGFTPQVPDRILDTRSSDPVGELDGSGDAYTLQVTGGDVPESATAVALNVTVVDGQANDFGGFVTVYPCGTRPDASNLNFISGQTVPNSVIAPLSATGTVCLYVYGQADLLVDVSGYL